MPKIDALTDVTDAFALVALYGPETTRIMEKVSTLDLTRTDKEAPFLLLGPVFRIPMQVVVMRKGSDVLAVLMNFPMGYGKSMIDAMLDAGEEFGLRPSGDRGFTDWFESNFPLPEK